VEENLRLGAYVRRTGRISEDLEEMFALFPILGQRINQPGSTLSAASSSSLLSLALMSHPRLLMLDGLRWAWPSLVDQIFNLVAALHKRGVTILLVEQNVDRTLDIVDRAYLLAPAKWRSPALPNSSGNTWISRRCI
jgi:branched-chain amino acid transport system ATP-binding protein